MPISPTSLTGTVRQTARGVARMVGAATEDTVAAFDVMRMTGVEPPPKDPFALRDPGYIRAYPPGIRENGGQYTHAALWSVMAFAELGDGDKAAGLFSLLNPINHARTRADVHRYKVEPYVVAADVYARPPHAGRGGWTWYTGSAGWMQRVGLESILGLRLEGKTLHLDPCIPRAWPGFEIVLRHGSARYEIRVENPDGAERGIAFAAVDEMVVTERPSSRMVGLPPPPAASTVRHRSGDSAPTITENCSAIPARFKT